MYDTNLHDIILSIWKNIFLYQFKFAIKLGTVNSIQSIFAFSLSHDTFYQFFTLSNSRDPYFESINYSDIVELR